MNTSAETLAKPTSLSSPGTGALRYALWAAFLIALCLFPFLVKNYVVFQFTLVFAYSIALMGQNILTGYNGQISLGHGAFYAVGAYTAAILMEHHELPFWATLPIAAIVTFVFGFLVGFPALRLEGHFLALATLALGVATPQMLKYKGIEEWTGGVQGIVLLKPEPPIDFELFGSTFNDDRYLYFVTLVVTLFMFWLAKNLLNGRVGRALISIRDHPIAASAMGVNLAIVKSTTFGVSAAFAGVAGALGGIAVSFVAPDSFPVFLSITFLVGIVVGGLASLWGPVFGALFIMFVPNIADSISKSAPWAVYGVFLIAFMYVMPYGIAGGIAKLSAKLFGKR